jgi:cysteinyl-tRNA synthetase
MGSRYYQRWRLAQYFGRLRFYQYLIIGQQNMLKIYDTLTRDKREFKPIQPGKVGIYVCGMTVYDYCHLGHARSLVAFDVIVRYLRARGFEVNFVRNITDIDDKIIERAHQNDESVTDLTDRFIGALHDDERALNIAPPDVEPRATGYIPHIIVLIERLIEQGTAYVAANGDVYFDVKKFPDYGKLSKKDLSGQQAGARVDVVDEKMQAADFALWKAAKPGEPEWDSPWGKGRPGWHIECSAMSMDALGESFDIHGGGADLQFPHHENEIAQSEAATHKPFVQTWMHVGYLQINRQKMSKSLGNFFTIRDVLALYQAEAVRYFLLSSHYRSQLNYSKDNLETAREALERLYTCLRGLPAAKAPATSEFIDRFHDAMDDDFNTPQALAVLFELTHLINQTRDTDLNKAAELGALLVKMGGVLGLLQAAPEAYLQGGFVDETVAQIEQLIQAREKARQDKNWSDADNLRDELHALGVELEDSASGTIWRRK